MPHLLVNHERRVLRLEALVCLALITHPQVGVDYPRDAVHVLRATRPQDQEAAFFIEDATGRAIDSREMSYARSSMKWRKLSTRWQVS
jgi:hypothetical protein